MADERTTTSKSSDWGAVVFAIILPSLVTLAYFVLASEATAGVQQLTYAVAKTGQFLLPVIWVFWIQRARSIPPVFGSSGVGFGIGFGVLVAASMLLAYEFFVRGAPFFQAGVQPIREKIAGIGITDPAAFAALGVFYSLIHSLLEEYYWRWFVFGQLTRLVSVRLAIGISSLGFMAHHVLVLGTYFGFFAPATWLFSLGVAVGGVFWAWLYHRSGSLLGPWISHLLVDAAIFILGYQIVSDLWAG